MSKAAADLEELCGLLQTVLAGPIRAAIVDSLVDGVDAPRALARLRSALRAQSFAAAPATRSLERLVRRLDQRTRRDGFRVLHSWDHRAHRFTDDITPVLMLDYWARVAGDDPDVRNAASLLLDYFFLHLLALCAMRTWDVPEPDALLDRVTALLNDLQGEHGSGHHFVEDAQTLLIYALSQFHPEEHAYDRLTERVATLQPARQIRFAIVSAAVLGCHLRWGFWLMYDRDVLRMRADNVGDYPWLLRSVATLMRAYAAPRGSGHPGGPAREDVVSGLLQGLAADPWAFTAKKTPVLSSYADEHAELRAALTEHAAELLRDAEAHRPTREAYSPLSLHFNFPHNALVALVAMSLFSGEPQRRSLDTLLVPSSGGDRSAAELARALTAYSGSSPDRLGAQGARLVAYDPLSGMRSFTMTTDAIRELSDPS